MELSAKKSVEIGFKPLIGPSTPYVIKMLQEIQSAFSLLTTKML